MTDKLTERELIDLYKKKAEEQVAKLGGFQRIIAESIASKFFSEYERRYLGETINPEDEQKKDMIAQMHRQAKEGKLPHPDELAQKINDFLMQQMGGVFTAGGGPIFGPQMDELFQQSGDLLERVKFDYKPQDIVGYLDRFVVGQEDAKKTLATAVFYHYNAIRQELGGHPISGYQKNNIVLIGNPGIGKTTLVKRIAELLNVPFGRYDASQFSPVGIVGKDATGIIREMVMAAKLNKQLAELGIVFVDEFDKLVKGYGVSGFGDSYGKDIQGTFLSILEDQEVDLIPEYHPLSMLSLGAGGKIRTKYMLFIVAGAFSGLEDIVAKRLGRGAIGFTTEDRAVDASRRKHDIFLQATHQDLVEYGFLSQLAGRLPIITALHELSPENLYRILSQAEGNILRQYQQQVATATGTSVDFEDVALKEIAERAYRMGTGARGLVTVIEGILQPLMFELPQHSELGQLTIRKKYLDDPRNLPQNVLKERYAAKYVEAYRTVNGIDLRFEDEAIKTLPFDTKKPQEFNDLLTEKLKDLSAALRLTSEKEFTVTPEFLAKPLDYLNQYVKRKLSPQQ